jgi:hypothetical protein
VQCAASARLGRQRDAATIDGEPISFARLALRDWAKLALGRDFAAFVLRSVVVELFGAVATARREPLAFAGFRFAHTPID